VINVITKSGTNEYHGLVYDFERHSYIEANNWFNNAAGLPNPSSSGTSSAPTRAARS
jgi:hypothetical protein